MEDIILANPPTDGISNVEFSLNNPDLLLVSSWDKIVRIYNTSTQTISGQYHHAAAALDCTFGDDSTVCYSGGLDRKLQQFDIVSGTATTVGEHASGICCVKYSKESNMLISGGWDQDVKIWDTKSENKLVTTIKQPGKVCAMDVFGNNIIVGNNMLGFNVYDTRNTDKPLYEMKSTQSYQTRCVCVNPSATSFIVGSIEGKVSVQVFEDASKNFAFKCHRTKAAVFPVNAIVYHPMHDAFATAGSDGTVILWDPVRRKRLKVLSRCSTGVSSLSFNSTGDKLAIAVSYNYEQGEKEVPAAHIVLRTVRESDVVKKQ